MRSIHDRFASVFTVTWALCWLCCMMLGCERQDSIRELAALQVSAGGKPIAIVVTEKELLAKTVTTLRISGHNGVLETMIDDDMRFGELVIAQYQSWILVFNEGRPVAGYDVANQELIGEGQLSRLPTQRLEQCKDIRLRKQIRPSDQSTMPAGYPWK